MLKATLIYTLSLAVLLLLKIFVLPYLRRGPQNKWEPREYDLDLPGESGVEPEGFERGTFSPKSPRQ